MKKKLLLPIFLVLLFSSCNEDDGDVEPMKWKTEVKKSSDGYITCHVKVEPSRSNALITAPFGLLLLQSKKSVKREKNSILDGWTQRIYA